MYLEIWSPEHTVHRLAGRQPDPVKGHGCMCQERSANFSLGLRALDVTLVILPYHYDILYIIIIFIFIYYFSILTVATHIMTAVKDSRVIHVSRITPQVVWSFISTSVLGC